MVLYAGIYGTVFAKIAPQICYKNSLRLNGNKLYNYLDLMYLLNYTILVTCMLMSCIVYQNSNETLIVLVPPMLLHCGHPQGLQDL